MPYCTSCGTALTPGARHACAGGGGGAGSEALLRAWAGGQPPPPSAPAPADHSTRKSRRTDVAARPGPVDPTLVSIINTDQGTAVAAVEIERSVEAELQAEARKRAPPLQRHVLVRQPS